MKKITQLMSITKPKHLALLFAVLPATAMAESAKPTLTPFAEMPAGAYALDKTHASLIWKVNHVGLSNYAARFTDFDVNLTIEPSDPAKSKVEVTVNPASVQTDFVATPEKDFNKKLATGEEWFNATKYPSIRFVSSRIEVTGEKTGKLHGDLTFLGATKPVVLDVTFNGAYAVQPFSQKPGLGFSASGVIKRSDWGFDTYVPTIGDDVAIQIEAEFVKKD